MLSTSAVSMALQNAIKHCAAAVSLHTLSPSQALAAGPLSSNSSRLHTTAQSNASAPSQPSLSPQFGGYMQSGQASQDIMHDDVPRFLVTGASGQVGAELVPYLRGECYRERVGATNVLASDVRSSRELLRNGPFIYCDVTDKDNLARIILENRITHVMHLATLLSAIGERNPQLALRVNTLGIQNILDLAATNNLTVFAPSTIAVFGNSTPRTATPDATVCEPSTMYGITKVHQELLGQYYRNKFGVDFRSLRYPGIISSHTLPGGGTTDYAVEMYLAALTGEPYKCFIHKNTKLPMMYMPDCLRATWELITAPKDSLTRCTYNVTAMSFTAEELQRSIAATVPSFEVAYAPDFRQDIANTWPESVDDSMARADWKWKHHFDLTGMTRDMLSKLAAKARPTRDSEMIDPRVAPGCDVKVGMAA